MLFGRRACEEWRRVELEREERGPCKSEGLSAESRAGVYSEENEGESCSEGIEELECLRLNGAGGERARADGLLIGRRCAFAASLNPPS